MTYRLAEWWLTSRVVDRVRQWVYSRAHRCPGCGGDAGNNWFDRSTCPEPCGSMHTRCQECGLAFDGCEYDR